MNPFEGSRAITQLSEDEVLFRDTVREFAEGEVAPLVRRMDEEQHLDPALLRKLFELGLMGIEIPEEFGGSAGSFFDSVLAVEMLSAVDPAVGLVVDVQNTLVVSALLRWGTTEQKKRYLPRLASDTVGAYALSEAGAGSDAFALQTRAEKRGDEYRLNGRKLWISNAKEAGVFIVFATVDASAGYKGITAFMVEKDAPGFKVGRKEEKLGIRASSTCELILDECVVAGSQVLGEVGSGYKIAMETLNGGRIGIGAQMLGLAAGAWAHAVKHAKERKQFGKALADFQAMQFQLAEMATDVEAARLMVYNAARLKDAQA
ncbi:MAG: acyl-CoA dehydrogenase family protein, partial [Terracidiphilus sp.]